MLDPITVSEVKELDGGKYSVRLTVEAPEGSLCRREFMAADDADDAVLAAKETFSRLLRKVTEYAIKNIARGNAKLKVA